MTFDILKCSIFKNNIIFKKRRRKISFPFNFFWYLHPAIYNTPECSAMKCSRHFTSFWITKQKNFLVNLLTQYSTECSTRHLKSISKISLTFKTIPLFKTGKRQKEKRKTLFLLIPSDIFILPYIIQKDKIEKKCSNNSC